MLQGTGRTVCGGVAIGKAVVYRPTKAQATDGADPTAERGAFDRACQEADRALAVLAAQTRQEMGEDAADIVEVQRMMLRDAEYTEAVYAAIERGHAAAQAALSCGEALAQTLIQTGDETMAARGADLRDMARRVYEQLLGDDGFVPPDEPFVLVAEELTPSLLLSMPRAYLRGIAVMHGTAFDHAAVLARGMGVPYLVGCDLPLDRIENKPIGVDAASGTWYVNPDVGTRRYLERLAAEKAAQRVAASVYCKRESITKSGKRVRVCATIATVQDAKEAFACGADGIGLMRSEWLYVGRAAPPEEDELYAVYRDIVQAMGGKPVVIRAPDIGADKAVSYAPSDEPNPALGVRGVRWCLQHPTWFYTHVRAVLRAAAVGPVRLMIPMVTTTDEMCAVREVCQRARDDLQKEGVACGDAAIGAMIETPAAALAVKELCEEGTFLSVGTNDLIQYTMAADRQNAAVETLCDPQHLAVQRQLREVAAAATANGMEAGVCGDLAADTAFVTPLLEMGYTAFSVPPDCIATVRRAVCESEV